MHSEPQFSCIYERKIVKRHFYLSQQHNNDVAGLTEHSFPIKVENGKGQKKFNNLKTFWKPSEKFQLILVPANYLQCTRVYFCTEHPIVPTESAFLSPLHQAQVSWLDTVPCFLFRNTGWNIFHFVLFLTPRVQEGQGFCWYTFSTAVSPVCHRLHLTHLQGSSTVLS